MHIYSSKYIYRNTKYYPLCFWAMAEAECLQYCYDRGFDWGGLYEDFNRVSCYCCPLKPLSELYTLWKKYPELWQATKDIEKGGTYRTFRADYTIDDLEIKFQLQEELENMPAPVEPTQLELW